MIANANQHSEHAIWTGCFQEDMDGLRLDLALTRCLKDYGRGTIQNWIKQAQVSIDQEIITKPRYIVKAGQQAKVKKTLEIAIHDQAEPLPLNIHYQDDQIILINKPVGLVVHPGAGNREGTLVNGLLHFDPALQQLPRAGIIHRHHRHRHPDEDQLLL